MNFTGKKQVRTYQQLLCILGCLLFTFSVAMSTQARSLEEITRTQEIRFCVVPIHPSIATAEPEGCREDCEFSGPVYEEALAFAASLGNEIQPRFLRVEWDEQFFNQDGVTVREAGYTPELLASGTCDLYPSNLTKNEWRLKKLDFVTLLPNRMMVIVPASQHSYVKSPADLAGKVAVIEKDTSYHTFLQEQNQSAYAENPIHIMLMATEKAFEAVDAGSVDFTIVDSDAALWSVRNLLKISVMAFPVGATDEVGWAFRKQDKDLQAAVEQFFTRQRADEHSDLNQIWKTYFGMSLTKFIMLVGSVK